MTVLKIDADKAFIESRVNARISEEKLKGMMNATARLFTARFIKAGPCGYKEQDDITYLSSEVLYRMANSFIGRPVILSPHDLNITDKNLSEKAKGYVVRCWTDNGREWFVQFIVDDPKVIDKIDNDGYEFVSCAYIITEKADEPEMHDGLECTTVVLDGFYHHLAITNSPRYDDSNIWRDNETKDLNQIRFSDIVKLNEEITSQPQEKKMGLKKLLGIKENEVEVADDVKFNTAYGSLSVSEMIAKLNEKKDEEDKANEDEEKKANEEKEKKAEEEKKNAKKCTEEGKENGDDEDEEKKKAKENELAAKASHEPGKAIPEAIAKANDANAALIKEGIAKANESGTTMTCKIRGLSAKQS